MSGKRTNPSQPAQQERTFLRFALGQRWEHAILLLSGLALLLTGLPQKYRLTGMRIRPTRCSATFTRSRGRESNRILPGFWPRARRDPSGSVSEKNA